MSEIDDKINELEKRLDELIKTQIAFQEKTTQIRYEIGVLRAVQQKYARLGRDEVYRQPVRETAPPPQSETPTERVAPPSVTEEPITEPEPTYIPHNRPQRAVPPSFGIPPPPSKTQEIPKQPSAFSRYVSEYAESARANLEEFIGENLFSKIGILVLLLGIGIGVKYSIDNNFISPLARVILGYIFGFGLIGIAIRVKGKYHNFSSVLISGGFATMYFVTYFAYSVYALINQPIAFALMAVFTVATVAAALIYNTQVIAHIGLVGAYAVPFLLSNNSGAYFFLFTYVSIINAGILAISIKRDWRPIIYTSSVFTWLIFLGWYATAYSADHFYLALVFLWLFFAIFYAANVVLSANDDQRGDYQGLITGVATAAVFYAFSFAISTTLTGTAEYVILLSYLAAVSVMIQATANIDMIAVSGSRKPLFYVASAFTWATLLAWFLNNYSPAEHFYMGLAFVGLFFSIFYVTRIVHAVTKPEGDKSENLASAILTAMVFYGFCFGISNLNFDNKEITILFSYLAIFSTAILITSYKFYGRFLVVVGYPATWLIYGSWFLQYYSVENSFYLAATFAAIFFAVYYVTTLIYCLLSDEISVAEHAGLMLSNSFISYGFGYAILDSKGDLRNYDGLYTAAHGLFHLAVALIFSRVKSKAGDVIQVLTILIITFFTLAVPVQFDGNHVTMIWAVEGALLFWLARLNQVKIFEYYSYPVMLLGTISLFIDWAHAYIDRTPYPSDLNQAVFANGNFVTALVFLCAFGFVFWVNRSSNFRPTISDQLTKPLSFILAAIGLFVLYNTFRIEIDNYFHLQTVAARTEQALDKQDDIFELNAIWQIIYSILFFAALNFANLRWVRLISLGYTAMALGVFSLFVLTVGGSVIFAELRVSYMVSVSPDFIYVAIRYIAYISVATMFFTLYHSFRDEELLNGSPSRAGELTFDALFYIDLLILASGELLNLMAQYRVPNSTKLGLSVLWGVFALALIGGGIRRAKKHLRIGAFVLLGITLIKLFLYDIADLPTIPKTILFVSLGILMLLVSFLYTKYKNVIFGEPEEEKL
jgi:uncharacterized membrane protein